MSVTLCCIGNINHDLMTFAIEKSIKTIEPDCVKVFCDTNLKITNTEHIYLPENFTRDSYSLFVLKDLYKYIDTTHVVIIQYDGFAVNKTYWSTNFLKYDYVGTTTHSNFKPLKSTLDTLTSYYPVVTSKSWYSLGGGFSLRSKKLLEATASSKFDPYIRIEHDTFLCEDISVGILYKSMLENNYGIVFGSVEDSIYWGSEHLTGYKECLGFHGWEQIPIFLTEEECIYYINKLVSSNTILDYNRVISFLGNSIKSEYFTVFNELKRITGITF